MIGGGGIAGFALLLAALAPATPWPEAARDLSAPAAIVAAADHFPNSSNLARRRLAAALDAGDKVAALAAVRHLAGMGGTLSVASRAKVALLVGSEAMAALAPALDANVAPLAASRLFATIPAEERLIEGLIWQPGTKRLYAASVVSRRLVVLDRHGGASAVAGTGLGSLLGGAWDSRRRLIWLASAVIDETPKGGALFSGLVGIDPSAPNHRLCLAAPPGAALGDVAALSDGTVYASDGLTGGVYRLRPGGASLETWIRPGILFSAQGMAASADGKWLYVADYRYGLAAVDRASGRVRRVAAPSEMMLDGIDGLVRHGRDLIAVQNGIAVPRIVRLRLAPDGLAITRLDVLERANPDWGVPGLATLAGDLLLYVADPQWESYGPGSAPAPGKAQHPTPVRAIALGPVPG
jgi:sugar lactone lactonase YvrE